MDKEENVKIQVKCYRREYTIDNGYYIVLKSIRKRMGRYR